MFGCCGADLNIQVQWDFAVHIRQVLAVRLGGWERCRLWMFMDHLMVIFALLSSFDKGITVKQGRDSGGGRLVTDFSGLIMASRTDK